MFIVALIKIAMLVGGLMTAAAYLVLVERWMAAWVQDRRGPNRVGIPLTKIAVFGLGQPLADGVKIILKESFTPSHVDKRLYTLAPFVILTAALAIFAVIPFGSVVPAPVINGAIDLINQTGLGLEHVTGAEPLLVAPLVDVGMLYVFALSSIAVYGVILGGWASNNKYSFLGGLRSSAQMISYELPLGLGILGVVLASGSLSIPTIIDQQANVWFVFLQPLGFVVFVVAAFAEAARLPFDLTECEQELIAGYHTEYGGVRLLMFLVAEFLHMITASFLIVMLFFGGWHLPFGLLAGAPDEVTAWGAFLRVAVLHTKILLVVLFFMLVRWSWPRFRFDQLMSLAWKVMLPLGVVNLVVIALLQEWQYISGDSTLAAFASFGISWIVFFLAWGAVAMIGPLVTDNTPVEDLDRYRIDSQI